MQALFKGLAPNYVKVVPSIAIAFVTYEQVGGPCPGVTARRLCCVCQALVRASAGSRGCCRPVDPASAVIACCSKVSMGTHPPARPRQVKEILGAEIRLSD